MRQFNQFEKEYINIIARQSYDSVRPFDLILRETFFTHENGIAFGFNWNFQKNILYISNDDDSTFVLNNYGKFFNLISLLDYLESKSFIYVVPIESKKGTSIGIIWDRFSSFKSKSFKHMLNNEGDYFLEEDQSYIFDSNDKDIYHGYEIPDSLFDKTTHLFLSLIYPTEELKEFVSNDFKSKEKIQFEKQLENANKSLKWTQLSFLVAIIAAVIAIIIPFIKNDTNINEKQVEAIINAIPKKTYTNIVKDSIN